MLKIIRWYSLIFIAISFIPLLLKNLIWPFKASLIWIAGMGILMIFQPKIILSRPFKSLFLLVLIYGAITILAENPSANLLHFDYDIIFCIASIFILNFYLKTNNYEGLTKVILWSLIFITFTLITSYIGFINFPESIRYSGGERSFELTYMKQLFFRKHGIADYDFFYAIAFTVPAFVYLAKKSVFEKSKKSIFFISLICIVFLVLIKGQYTTAILLSMASFFLAMIGFSRYKKNRIVILLIIFLVIMVPNYFYSNILNTLSLQVEEGSTLQRRIEDLAYTVKFEDDVDTHANRRLDRLPFLWKQFTKSPLIGGGEVTGHVYWLDILALTGLIGFIPFIILIYSQIKINLRVIPDDYKYYYLLCVFSFIINGFFKGGGGLPVYLCVFLITPGIGLSNKILFTTENKLLI